MAEQTTSTSTASLSQQAADALLEAITDNASKAKSSESIHHLADAYAAVREAMPKKAGTTARKIGT